MVKIAMAGKTNYSVNGQRYYRIRVKVGISSDGSPIRKTFYGKNKKEAEEMRDEFLSGIKGGLNVDFQSMTLGTLMKIWLDEDVRVSSADASYERYETVYRIYVKDSELNNLVVSSVKPLLLQTYYNKLFVSGKSSNIIFNLNKVLKTFFNFVIAQGYILVNPCFRLSIPKKDEQTVSNADDEGDIDPLTDSEIEQITPYLRNDLKMIFLLALGTGLRRGELLGLTFGSINIVKKELYVTNALKRVKHFNTDGTHNYTTDLKKTKTKNSKRTVPIPSSLIPPLRRYIVAEKERHLANKHPFSEKNLLFTSPSFAPRDGKNVLTSWKRTQKRAGVRERSFHNIRHTYATRLFEQDVPLKTVSILLGHANIAITANTYTHVMPRQKVDAVEKLDYMFARHRQ